ncbi:uncharacterized protein Z518_00528 [Rhinocladiella mackenziei CBS 650.93]|uniref:Uncharacterized protein n=1 Tax=Rhinocladiella mackenziei CBS 650.93 TaxID=1442369 RepID=A0A0D2HFI9_9EURO|nr:uncharacterized protein Z518_00528 [Rhinocladiella mackenziei CBS 650.93]KIX09448.1 hypothetical protein Z518_00528 [Rhinocladiella mackenziei CBS 650.93]
MAGNKYNVGIIGYGLSAKIFHIPFVNAVSDFNLYAIVQRSPKPDDDASIDHPNIKLYRSADDMVQDDQVDVVVVTTAPESHFQLAKMATQKKKHVIVEKPFTPTSAEARELVDLAKSQGVILTVYQNRRWDSDFLTLQKHIEDGTLGRIVEFETHFDRHRPDPPADNWKAYHAPGTGAVYDLGTHLMDQVVHLFGMPERITGFVGSQREMNTTGLEDSCTVLLHYGKMLVTVKAGVVSPEVNQLRFWVRGDKGSFKKFHLDPQEDQLRHEGLRPGDPGYGYEPEDRYGTMNISKDGKIVSEVAPTVKPPTYTEYYQRLAAALNGDVSKVPVPPEQAVGVIRLVELARESSKLGKTLTDIVQRDYGFAFTWHNRVHDYRYLNAPPYDARLGTVEHKLSAAFSVFRTIIAIHRCCQQGGTLLGLVTPMFNGCHRVIHDSGPSRPVSRALTLRPACCYDEVSIGQIPRLERSWTPWYAISERRIPPKHPFYLFCTTSCRQRKNGLRGQRLQDHRNRRKFSTVSILLLNPAKTRHASALGLPARRPSDHHHLPPGRPPGPGSLPPFPGTLAPPRSGNRRRAENVGAPNPLLPENPLQEQERQTEISWRKQEWVAAYKRKEESAWGIVRKLELEHTSRESIASILASARDRAKEEYWKMRAKEHVAQLIAPIERRLQLLDDGISVIRTDLTQLRDERQQFKNSLREKGVMLEWQLNFVAEQGSINDTLRESTKVFQDITDDILCDSNLWSIARDLATRGLWEKGSIPSTDAAKEHFTSTGAKGWNIKRAMSEILLLRFEAQVLGREVSAELHKLRKIRRCDMLYTNLPELFEFDVRHLQFYLLLYDIETNSFEILRRWEQLQGRHPTKRADYYRSASRYLAKKMYNRALGTATLFITSFSQYQLSGLRSNLPLQTAQVLKFRPFAIFQARAHSLMVSVQKFISSEFWLPRDSLEGRERHYKFTSIKDAMIADRREIWRLLTNATIWTGISSMTIGISSPPRTRSDLMTSVHPTPEARANPQSILGLPSAGKQDDPPWRRPKNLYPRDAAIPIHHVVDVEFALDVLKRFSTSKALGIDTAIHAVSPSRNHYARVEFMMLASDREVAIFHLGVMSAGEILRFDRFQSVLGNPGILKVGVNMNLQRTRLASDFLIDMEGCYDLTGDQGQICHDSIEDPTIGFISALVDRSYRHALPQLTLQRATWEAGMDNPTGFFTHLAARPYAALQLYHLVHRESQDIVPCSLDSLHSSASAFGPVLLYKKISNVPGKSRDLRKGNDLEQSSDLEQSNDLDHSDRLPRSPHLARTLSRAEYLRRLTGAMALKTLQTARFCRKLKKIQVPFRSSWKRQWIRNLQAYYLFTTFNEKPKTIRDYLRISNPSSSILAFADRAKLPLNEGDHLLLRLTRSWEPVLKDKTLDHSASLPRKQSNSSQDVKPLPFAIANASVGRLRAGSATKIRHMPLKCDARTMTVTTRNNERIDDGAKQAAASQAHQKPWVASARLKTLSAKSNQRLKSTKRA